MTDVMLVVTARDETIVAGPTILAVEAAAAHARSHGLSVQPVLALDRPSDATAAYFERDRFDGWRVRIGRDDGWHDAVVAESDADSIGFLAAGDLVSENWITRAATRLGEAAASGERVIAHPELTIAFDGATSVVVDVDQTAPLFSPHHLALGGGIGAVCLAPRAAYAGSAPRSSDLDLTVTTMGAGWLHLVIRDTIVFRRHRALPVAHQGGPAAPMLGALPELAIDRVWALGRRATDRG